MRQKLELDVFRKNLLSDNFEDLRADLEKFDNQKCTFYYDESNNIRKLWMRDDDFNASANKDFVLGGVMLFGEREDIDVLNLKAKLRLQKNILEIKFKHITKKKCFLECLSDDKVTVFLQWLLENKLYVHFSNVNNLYFALVDIVDSIDISMTIIDVFQVKNELYKIARENYRAFYELLVSVNYPNVVGQNIEKLYRGILYLIENGSGELTFYIKSLCQILKVACQQEELSFLQGNLEKTILENYSCFYMRPIGVFPYAQHVFDNEYKVEEIFANYNFSCDNNIIRNYKFVNSKDDLLIQVSDCVVNLIGKYYAYINNTDIDEVFRMQKNITPEQKHNLQLFSSLITRSENISKLLIHSIQSREEHDVSSLVLMFGRI